MIKCTLTPIAMCTLFLFVSLLFSCTRDSDLLVDQIMGDNNGINQIETDSIGQEIPEEIIASPLTSPFPYCQLDPNPIGGGAGYAAILAPPDATIYIDSFTSIEDFKNTIESAPEKSVIYIDDNLSIDLTGLYKQTGSASILVPANITIASGRGIGMGALIFTKDFGYAGSDVPEDEPLFKVGKNVRITGIRLKGPSEDLGSDIKNEMKIKTAILIGSNSGLEVDNCELYGWPLAGIQVGGNLNSSGILLRSRIHHNFIYNNRQKSLGYGIVIYDGYASISSNIFMANRHDIAGGGKLGSGYEASCNLIRSGGVGHNFDMHAEGTDDSTANAGSFVFIHHNDFEDVGANRYTGQGKDNIIIRGRPEIQCRIENNRFKHEEPKSAIRQINSHGGYGNMLVWNNIYKEKRYLGWYVKKKWLKSNASNFINLKSSNDGMMRSPETGSDYDYNYTFGDYDGDGNTDIFKLENGFIFMLPLNASESGPSTKWQLIKKTAYSFASLHFGFYDEDNRTDIIVQDGNNINMASGFNSGWQPLLNTTYKLASMQSGDFDGNGIEDLFLANGTQWMVAHDSKVDWQVLKPSIENSNELKLGFFDNNNIIDVLKVNASSLMVSYDGTSSWTTLASTTFETADFEIADFNGDNLSDIIQPNLGQVFINGSSTWKLCGTDNFPIDLFPYGDF